MRVWFHAVSVGEVNLLRPLVEERAGGRPHWEVVVSTTTTDGLALARKTYPDLVTFYALFDFSWATRRCLWPASGHRPWSWSSWRSGRT